MKRMKNWEKVIIVCVVAVCVGVLVAVAGDLGAPSGGLGAVIVTFPPENTFTVLTANTMGFTSASMDMGFTATKLSILTTWSGTAPTNMASAVLGSIDNSSFITLVTNTMTASPTIYFQVDKPVRYVKGKFASKSGGDATSKMTMKVTGTR